MSKVNPNIPAQGANLSSAEIRQNFAATAIGVTDGSDAAAGQIGEWFYASSASSTVSNNVILDVMNYTLPAGDWDIMGNIALSGSSQNMQNMACWVNTQSATKPASNLLFSINSMNFGLGGQQTITVANTQFLTGVARLSAATPTIIYLSAQIGYGNGTVFVSGALRGRRMR